jgi:Polyketide cyclase / dehydrase and lipid transport
MATICVETTIEAAPEEVWDALRDFGALHTRLAPGFAVDTKLEGSDRLVTFFTGTTLRERLISRDDDARRLAWTIVDGPYEHHNGAARVVANEDGTATFVWTSDLLPDAAAEPTRAMMKQGSEAIRRALESARSAA